MLPFTPLVSEVILWEDSQPTVFWGEGYSNIKCCILFCSKWNKTKKVLYKGRHLAVWKCSAVASSGNRWFCMSVHPLPCCHLTKNDGLPFYTHGMNWGSHVSILTSDSPLLGYTVFDPDYFAHYPVDEERLETSNRLPGVGVSEMLSAESFNWNFEWSGPL